jgi:hypothetical protein
VRERSQRYSAKFCSRGPDTAGFPKHRPELPWESATRGPCGEMLGG